MIHYSTNYLRSFLIDRCNSIKSKGFEYSAVTILSPQNTNVRENMDYILKEYKRRCKDEFSKYGFKSYRNNHYRIIGDIFQSFNLHQSVSGTDCNTIFGIVPLSVEYKLDKSFVNPCRVTDFEDNRPWYNYNRNLEASVEKCINEMILCMNKYLMPVFEKALDSESAYLTIVEHDNVFKGNSYERFCMCLKFGDYINAKKHLQEVIEQHENAFRRNKEALGNNITQEYIQKMEERISQKEKLLILIDNKDYDAIQNLMSENEKRNRQNLGIKD